jgi:squalene-hopene/tetraprenyl-beta-curcumene cyclase
VNYIYGTWSVLCALGRAELDADHPMVARAVNWLKSVQNEDGGWGESCDSYALDRKGHEFAASTASQTAWALLGLMAVGEARSPEVARGVEWLLANQAEDGLWGQEVYTGGGFPRVFYLRYHGYPRYFPLWALARYRNLSDSNSERTAWGCNDKPVIAVTGTLREGDLVKGLGVTVVAGGSTPSACARSLPRWRRMPRASSALAWRAPSTGI